MGPDVVHSNKLPGEAEVAGLSSTCEYQSPGTYCFWVWKRRDVLLQHYFCWLYNYTGAIETEGFSLASLEFLFPSLSLLTFGFFL